MAEPRTRRWVAGAALAIVVTGLAFAGTRLLPARATTGPGDAHAAPAATAKVTRTDLTTTVSVNGDLGFGPPQQILGGLGTVTWLPAIGTVVRRGETLYRRDDRPVPLLYGDTPLFRDLDTPGLVGRDVRVLADNLKALGYPIGAQPTPGQTVAAPVPAASAAPSTGATARVRIREGDAVLTSGLVAAVRRWQTSYGVPATGVVEPADVVVYTGTVRVSTLIAQRGSPAGAPLMTVTGTTKAVTISLAVAEAGSIHQGDVVTVTLPDGRRLPAKVTDIGTDAQSADSADPPKIIVTVTLDDASAVDRLNAAPVRVDILGETHRNVLAVPVGALLAVLEGGYAVQIAGGPVVPVHTGLFANGQVEITGPGIDDGVTVVTTS